VGESPSFLMELKTLMLPVAIVVGGAVTASTISSGRTTLLSFPTRRSSDLSSCSAIWFSASATAMRKYEPAEVLAGIVTMVLALEKTPAARLGTARLPRSTAVPSSVASLDRNKRAVDAEATVGGSPMLRIEL